MKPRTILQLCLACNVLLLTFVSAGFARTASAGEWFNAAAYALSGLLCGYALAAVVVVWKRHFSGGRGR